MFNFRTQHLRGTTVEWENSSLIPKQGELVFEECSDGVTRIKIGNGGSLFKDLKYVDEKTAEDILVLQNRISEIVADASVNKNDVETEVADIRAGYDGLTYATAGDAVRAVGEDMLSLRRSLEQFIGADAVNGLHYEDDMLYLKAGETVLEETGVRVVSGSGGGGGGTGSYSKLKIAFITTSPVTCTPKDQVMLGFKFTGEDSSGDTILQANATWKVDGKIVGYSTVKDGDNYYDITKYLKVGTTKVLLTVTDDTGAVATKNWSIQQIDLRLESSFDDTRTYPLDDLLFEYTPHGAIDKTLFVYLDGELISEQVVAAKFSGSELKFEIEKQPHGSHLLEAYLEATINDETVESNHIYKDIIWYDENAADPVISSRSRTFTAKQYDTVNIEYTVYDPTNETPEVNIYVDNKLVSTLFLTTPTATYSYTTTEVKTHTVEIRCGDVTKTVEVIIEKLDIDVQPVTAGLVMDFSPIGKSNDSADRLWQNDEVKMTVSDNFDWINGGYKHDENGDSYFCIKSGSRATFDYKLFGDDAKANGKEFKLIFKTTNVSHPETTFLSCVDGTTDKNRIGLDMQVHNATIYGQNGALELSYSEDDIIEFEFNISKLKVNDLDNVPMIMGYEDGVATRPLVYDSSYNFQQTNKKDIVIGSDDCDVHIYRLKVYNTSLTDLDILNNFIADARNTKDMVDRYERNQIYDENGLLDPHLLAEKCPWLRVYIVSAPRFTTSKDDKVSGTTIQQIYKGGDPVLDNWTCFNAQHSGQGTSSNNYGAAGRNLDFIMNKDDSYFVLGDGTTAKEITLTRESVPVDYLNAKVNIASSNNLTNALLANRYNRYNPYKRPFVREEGFDTSIIKDTMEFHNCVIFIEETAANLDTHTEFYDKDVHFYAIGNIGDSKKTDKTRLTDPSDKYECCVEIMDVGLALSGFPKDTMRNVMNDYVEDEKTHERTYIWLKPENLSILYEKTASGDYIKTQDTEIDFTKTYYVDMLVNDDFSENFTYGWRYCSNKKDKAITDVCKSAWIDFYRFVTTSTDQEFKANLNEYFVVDSALFYYLFTTRYCMVDNRAKNTFWHYGKCADGKRRWDLCWDYDNDTSLGLNNFGKQTYRYGLEDFDTDETGEEVFRQSDSLFFCRIRDLFADELAEMYRELETQSSVNPWSSTLFIKECDDWQDQFPEELWRLDIQRKYIRTYTSSFINKPGDPQFLVNMANGKMKYHRRQWERNQELYMASKYQTTTASSDQYHANFRMGRPDENVSDIVVTPDYRLTLTPYLYMYLNVDYGGQLKNITRTRVTELDKPVTLPVPSNVSEADIVNVWSASGLTDLGDLSACYPRTVSVGNAKRIKKLTVGNNKEGYQNTVLETLSTTNPLLEELDLTNVSSLNTTLKLDKLINLKTFKAFGTNIPSVDFAEGSKVNYIELPAINTLTLKSLAYLSNDNLHIASYDNIEELTIDECKLIDGLALLKKCSKLKRLRLTNIDFGTQTYEEFSELFFGLNGVSSTGTITEDAYITGTVYFKELTGTQYTELKKRYPLLTVHYGGLTCTVTFHYSDGSVACDPYIIYNAGDIPVDPVEDERMSTPTKESTAQYHFTWAGWSDVNDGVPVNTDFLSDITNDYNLYPTYTSTPRRYIVEFRNNNDDVLETKEVLYGTENVLYTGNTPVKQNTTSPDAFDFIGWQPEPKNITGNLVTYAVYTLNKDKLTSITIDQFAYDKDDATLTLNISSYLITDDAPQVLKINNTYVPEGLSNEYTVTSIGNQSGQKGFQNAGIEYVDLPETIEHVGSYAFKDNNLTEVTIPESVSRLGKHCFANMPLQNVYYNAVNATLYDPDDNTSNKAPFNNVTTTAGYNVHIGPAVETIGQYLFYPTSSIDNGGHISKLIFASGSNCKTIEKFAFNASGCRSVEFNNAPIKEIGNSAFAGCNLSSVEFPVTLQKIGANAFNGNKNLNQVWLPASVNNIGNYAFTSCADDLNFTLSSTSYFNWSDNCLFATSNNKDQAGTLLFGNGIDVDIKDKNWGIRTIGTGAFQYSKTQSIKLPSTTKTIGQYAFNKSSVKTVDLPYGLNSIGSWAFDGAEITSIVIPETVSSISSYAFARCKNLIEATLPDALTTINLGVFKECYNLETVNIKSTTTGWSLDNADLIFVGCEKLKNITVGFETTNDNAARIMAKAPWGAGTDKDGNIIVTDGHTVTVNYADKSIAYVYNAETGNYEPQEITD